MTMACRRWLVPPVQEHNTVANSTVAAKNTLLVTAATKNTLVTTKNASLVATAVKNTTKDATVVAAKNAREDATVVAAAKDATVVAAKNAREVAAKNAAVVAATKDALEVATKNASVVATASNTLVAATNTLVVATGNASVATNTSVDGAQETMLYRFSSTNYTAGCSSRCGVGLCRTNGSESRQQCALECCATPLCLQLNASAYDEEDGLELHGWM
ncbi:hypothetical protein BTVI_47971 [Pitangus sulphuratus]|nr:hypothetical protein BTVI_47971 [Pitangus sulphuratus]